jgi:hypothetical protein
MVTKMECTNFASVLDCNGNLFLWGPTPIGSYNSPQKL